MLDKKSAAALIEKVTAMTKNYAQARVISTQAGSTRFAKSEISQNVSVTDTTLTLTVYNGKKEATASTNVLTDAGLAQLAADADALLAHVPEGEYEAFPYPQACGNAPTGEDSQSVATCDQLKNSQPPNDLRQKFSTAERAALLKAGVAQAESGYSASGALVLNEQAVALGDNRGAFNYAAYNDVAFNTVVTSDCGADGAAEACSYTAAPDIVALFARAQQTAKAARNPVEAELGAHTVVLSPVAFGDLMYFLSMTLNAKAIDDGYSFAAGKLGQRVFGANLTVHDDATHPDLRPLPFDFEGNPRRPLTLIENGVIRNVLYDNRRAQKHGVTPTGHAAPGFGGMMGAFAANLIVDAGSQSLAEIIASTPRGIYINEFHYTNFVNPRKLQITGLTRNGAFRIQDGKLGAPISTVRFTESLLDAFNNITAISSDHEKVSGMGVTLMPGVRIEGFHFTSKA
ncbi:MAG: TldD/PmbA family protein [Defluviitaleaceae bacterium]|nr:TldD/PmbA family protein [Defluviitaleaceae bacterium]